VRSRDAPRGGAGGSGGTAAAPCFAPRLAPAAFAQHVCVRRRRRSAEGVGGAASSSPAASAPRARGAAPRDAASATAGICEEEGREVSGETSWSDLCAQREGGGGRAACVAGMCSFGASERGAPVFCVVEKT
jgi:hypothetical protein